jgi:hypothetical protein
VCNISVNKDSQAECILKMFRIKLGMVVHTCNPNTYEAEAGGL